MTDLVRFSIELIEIFRSSATRPSLSWWNVCCKQACVLNAPQNLTNCFSMINCMCISKSSFSTLQCIYHMHSHTYRKHCPICLFRMFHLHWIRFSVQYTNQIDNTLRNNSILRWLSASECASVSLCVCWNTVVRCVHNKVLKRHHQIIFNLNYICK